MLIIDHGRTVWRANHAPLQRRTLDDPRLTVLLNPDSQRATCFRLLRDTLLPKRTRIIMVSSGAPKEGKTTCATNLAFAMSERPNARVLLLESNFSAPSLSRIFHIDALTPPVPSTDEPWLFPYRVAEVSARFHVAAIVPHAYPPAHAFCPDWFHLVVEHLSGGRYDHVIIDGAEMDESPGLAHIARIADGTLLTARAGGTRAATLHRAAGLVPRDRALGIVLMDAETWS
jgi:Mrp family chromosome partitioning ATPase